MDAARGSTRRALSDDCSGHFRKRHQYRTPDPADDAGRRSRLGAEHIDRSGGPIHLVGHSYGGAVAFKIATSAAYANRIRSLTLIEPVLPTLLRESAADRRLHDLFATFARQIYVDLWDGMYMEALDKFLRFWNGSGPGETPSGEARLRMIEQIEKKPFDTPPLLLRKMSVRRP